MTSSSLDMHTKKILRVNPAHQASLWQGARVLCQATWRHPALSPHSNTCMLAQNGDFRDICVQTTSCQWVVGESLLRHEGLECHLSEIPSSLKWLWQEPKHLVLFSELPASELRARQTHLYCQRGYVKEIPASGCSLDFTVSWWQGPERLGSGLK